jgi:hypothetical protein
MNNFLERKGNKIVTSSIDLKNYSRGN